MTDKPVMPSDVSDQIGWFDRFAGMASVLASRAWFFAFCVLLVLVWAPSILVFRDVDTWQLIINTLTTIITFLMVTLLQNSQTRADLAVQHKLNAIVKSLSDLMQAQADERRANAEDRETHASLAQAVRDIAELRLAVGIEERESTTNNSATDAPT